MLCFMLHIYNIRLASICVCIQKLYVFEIVAQEITMAPMETPLQQYMNKLVYVLTTQY